MKRVEGLNVKIRVKADGSGVELANVMMSMNPFDEIGIEEALRIKDAGKATEVVAYPSALRGAGGNHPHALAMGADRGLLVKCDPSPSRWRWPRSSRA